MPEDVANPRKAELRRLVERAETIEQELDDVLRPARDALAAGAWVSSAARPFEALKRDLVDALSRLHEKP